MSYCEGCIERERTIYELEEQIKKLKQKLRYEERITKEGYFGSSTPSSKKPFKKNTKDDCQKNGGAKKGHQGHGRKSISFNEADSVDNITVGTMCPYCHGALEDKGDTERSVIDIVSQKAAKKKYLCRKKWCSRCRKTFTAKAPVLSRSLYGNQLIARAATMHYIHGVALGRIEAILGNIIPSGSLYHIFHRLADLWKPAIPLLIDEYRREPVKHADETGWRNDGKSGYAWIFCSENISLLKFVQTRSSQIPHDILGPEKLTGVLVVDRYNAYNRVPCRLQYCYAHLLRKVKDLEKQFIEEREIINFVSILAPLLAEAMHLRTTDISDKIYYKKATALKKKIVKIIDAPSRHAGIKEIQTIFKEKKHRLYHWEKNRAVPADNNRAEREIRPTVIARKVSFGSQSDKGAATRSTLMSILKTAQKRLTTQSIEDWFKETLDKMALNHNNILPYSLLPPKPG